MQGAELVAATIRHECTGEPDLMLRLRKAMKAAKNHWMVTDENEQFRGALAAAMLESSGDERDRIGRSARAMGKVGAVIRALQSGVPVDLEAMAAEPQEADLLPLGKMWQELED